MSDEFDPYYAWLGIPPKDQPANHYRLLGVELFESNLDVIESAAFRQMGHVRTYQGGKHSQASQQLLNELSAAKLCLLEQEKKETYDQQLRATIEAVAAFIPDDAVETPLPASAFTPSAIRVINSDSDATGAAVASNRSTSVAAGRRKSSRPKPKLPMVIAAIVVVVGGGIALLVGGMLLKDEPPVVNRPPVKPAVTPSVDLNETPSTGLETANNNTTPSPSSNSQTQTPPPTTNSVRTGTTQTTPRSVASLNESTQQFPAMVESRLRFPLPMPLKMSFEDAAGFASDDFAFAQTMPYGNLLQNITQLRHLGYRPLRLRPFDSVGESRVASTWTRDAIDWRIVFGGEADVIKQADEKLQEQGFRPIDVACWQANGNKFAAVWAKLPSPSESYELMLGIPDSKFPAEAATARAWGMMPASHHVTHDTNGERLYSVVWHKPDKVLPWHHWDDTRDVHESSLKRPGAPQDVCLTHDPTTGEVKYGGLLVGLPNPNTLELHGYEAQDHLTECKKLITQGYRPIAISATSRFSTQQTVAASVWQRGTSSAVASRPSNTNRTPTTTPAPRTTTQSTVAASATHALHCDGHDGIMITNTSNVASMRNSFTAEMWFRFSEPSPQAEFVLMGTTSYRESDPRVNSGNAVGWHVAAGERQSNSTEQAIALRWSDSRGGIIGTSRPVGSLGTAWHHIAVCNIVRGSTWQTSVYLDGQPKQSSARPLTEATQSPSDFFLATSQYLTDRHSFKGDIKAFRLSSNVRYQTPFQPTETFTSDSSTLALLDFNGANPALAQDVSGNNRHGVISGATWIAVTASVSPPMVASKVAESPTASDSAAPKERLAVPPGAERTASSKKVRDIFANDFEAAKDKTAKIALSQELLQRGREEQDPAAKFALLFEGRELVMNAAELQMALQATDELTSTFEVDEWVLKCDTMAKLANAAKADTERRSIAMASLLMADEAIENADWESARKLVTAASRANLRLKDADIVRTINQKRRLVQVQKKLWEDAEQAATLLAASPDDPAANLTLGRYRCLVRNDWEAGLPHLAKGSDEQLAAIAALEAKKPTASDALELANQWYEWGEKASESDKNGALQRAKHWYSTALPKLSGLDRTVATKKLDELNDKVDSKSPSSKRLSWLGAEVGVLKRLEGHTSEVTSLDVSGSGTTLVSGSYDNTVRLWDLASGRETGKIDS